METPETRNGRTGAEAAATTPSADILYDGRRIALGEGPLSLGSHRDNGLPLLRGRAERRHAVIELTGGAYRVTDLGTADGTCVDGERLHGEARNLEPGDTITVGGEALRFIPRGGEALAAVSTLNDRLELVNYRGEPLSIGSSNANDIVLDDVNVSRFHAEIAPARGGEVELRDLKSRCGTRVDGRPAQRAAIHTGTEIGVGPFRLIFDGANVLARNDRGALRLDAHEVGVKVSDTRILRPTSLSIEPGELVVIIGESGSGKTTLIKALAGVTEPSEGNVEINGEAVTARLTDIGYVPQDEIVHRDLRVEEALDYAARLRLPPDTPRQTAELAISTVLEELSLEEHAETRIGSLSGGQRKRAGVAAELVNRPSLLFLDEPTTGLDPALESQLMRLFRQLAEADARAVCLVTHATRNLELCDRLVVMGRGGELCFHGSPEAALGFFGVSAFDEIYDALASRPPAEWREKHERENERGSPSGATATVPSAGPEGSGRAKQRSGAQAGLLARRYATLFLRDERNLLILLGQVPVLGVLIGLLFKSGLFGDPGQPGDAAQLLFVLATTTIWLGSIDGAREIIKERSVAAREHAVGVRWSAYLASKLMVLFTLAAVQALILAGIVFVIHPLEEPRETVMLVLGILVLTSFVSVGVGLLISAAVRTEDQATSFIPLTLIPQLLLAGAIVPVERMGDVIAAVSTVIFGRWAFAGIGTAVDMNERIDRVPQFAAANGYGESFFDLPGGLTLAILGGFLLLTLAGVALLLARRRT